MKIRAKWLFPVVTLSLLLTACGRSADDKPDDDGEARTPLYECGEVLTGEFEAAEWVRAVSDIRRYRYTVTADRESVDFELLDEAGDPLAGMNVGSMAIGETEKNLGAGVDPEEVVQTARLTVEGAEPIDLQAVDGNGPDGVYRVLVDLERAGGRVHLVADFGQETCQPPAETGDYPDCVGYVPLADRPYTLPSCGFRRDQQGEDLAVTSLTYYTRSDEPVADLNVAGVTLLDEERYASMQVVDRGRIAPADDVTAWAERTGADAIVGTDAEQLLTVAFLDQPWLQQVREHTEYCQEPDLFPPRTSALCPSSDQPGVARQSIGSPSGCLNNYGPLLADPNPKEFQFSCKGIGCLGWVWGDPHLQTHDGVAYDFQGAGEFVVVASDQPSPMVVQGRFEPIRNAPNLPACGNVTVATAVAVGIGERRIAIYGRQKPALFVDGQPHEVGVDPIELPDGASLTRESSGSYIVGWPDATAVRVTTGNFMRIDFLVSDERAGTLRGLLGNFNGVDGDDFALRDGTPLDSPVPFDELYAVFGESWRVSASESLFDYDEGGGPEDFHDRNFPDGPTSLEGVDEELAAEAREVCGEREIADPFHFDSCVLDYLCTSDPTLADDAAEAPEPSATLRPNILLKGQLRAVETADQLTTPDGQGDRCEAPLRMGFVLEEAVDVELTAPVTVDEPASEVAAGETVDSYFIHLPAYAADTRPVEGTIVFAGEVVGVIRTEASMTASAQLANPNFDYPTGADLALEDRDDVVLIGADRRSVQLLLDGTSSGDQLRILVREVAP